MRLAGELGLTEAEVLSALPHGGSAGRAVLSVAAKGSVAAFADSVGDFLCKDVAVACELTGRLGSDLGLLDPLSARRSARAERGIPRSFRSAAAPPFPL
ncbi:hypothetical protein [Nocardia grenadensis]|uniref:hypothetical protein n=1 Tax=Nocardia grenadensis TaxID=931537 RepID=UPI0007A37717|nr:hypothetical protein [Nocardia grenadensis]